MGPDAMKGFPNPIMYFLCKFLSIMESYLLMLSRSSTKAPWGWVTIRRAIDSNWSKSRQIQHQKDASQIIFKLQNIKTAVLTLSRVGDENQYQIIIIMNCCVPQCSFFCSTWSNYQVRLSERKWHRKKVFITESLVKYHQYCRSVQKTKLVSKENYT